MTVHTLKFVYKKRGHCKGAFREEGADEVRKCEAIRKPGSAKPTKTITIITDDIVNTYIKGNLETVTHYLRNERVMETQKANERNAVIKQCILK